MTKAATDGGYGEGEAAGDVVAVADEGDAQAGEASFCLLDGLQVRHCLAGVFPIGEGVDYHNGGVFGEFFQG